MPRSNVDDYNDAIRLSGGNDSPLGYRWETTPENTFMLTTEYSEEFIRQITTDINEANSRVVPVWSVGRIAIECEVCGAPIEDVRFHICKRCRAAAKKFKDYLTEEDVRNG